METKDPALTKSRITETDAHHTKAENGTMDTHPINHDEIEKNITENKGTDTFTEDVVDSEHVNDNDNPARQPDRRDQESNGFDDNINEETVGSEAPDSYSVNDMNRYANIDNAQTRVLNPDQKNSNR
ncbi:hypothetical protein [Psychrobacter alimentarius]|uniref:hypothetical protein n=1 Tax=Psychrobacter alimentarius TaxID=261164 RepID=UPI001918AEAE|nr:hypothetical protein [Psychrobacter alimentarius]